MTALRLILGCLLLGTWTTAAAQQTIRVRLLEQQDPQAVTAHVTQGSLEVFAGEAGAPIARLGPGERIRIGRQRGEVHTTLHGGSVHALALRLVPAGGAEVTLDVAEGKRLEAPRTYRGAIVVGVDPAAPELRVVNHIDLETYVACVLPHEYGFDDLEGAKAMAVVIRTYSLKSKGKFGPDYDHVDHVASQVYVGTAGLTPLALEAARATQGEVLTYRGGLIEATYFASSGGHTADNEDVWEAEPLPYLRGKPDPFDTSPHTAWRSTIPRAKLLEVLSGAYGGRVEGFAPMERSPEGRVRSIELVLAGGGRRTIQANAFRMLLNRHFGVHSVKSTRFEARRSGETYVFEGKGFGHGVGLCQWGAHEMSRRSHSYREILTFYYTGVELAQMIADTLIPVPTPEPPSFEEILAQDSLQGQELPAAPGEPYPAGAEVLPAAPPQAGPAAPRRTRSADVEPPDSLARPDPAPARRTTPAEASTRRRGW